MLSTAEDPMYSTVAADSKVETVCSTQSASIAAVVSTVQTGSQENRELRTETTPLDPPVDQKLASHKLSMMKFAMDHFRQGEERWVHGLATSHARIA